MDILDPVLAPDIFEIPQGLDSVDDVDIITKAPAPYSSTGVSRIFKLQLIWREWRSTYGQNIDEVLDRAHWSWYTRRLEHLLVILSEECKSNQVVADLFLLKTLACDTLCDAIRHLFVQISYRWGDTQPARSIFNSREVHMSCQELVEDAEHILAHLRGFSYRQGIREKRKAYTTITNQLYTLFLIPCMDTEPWREICFDLLETINKHSDFASEPLSTPDRDILDGHETGLVTSPTSLHSDIADLVDIGFGLSCRYTKASYEEDLDF